MSMGDPGESRDIDSELTVVQEAAQLITEGIDLDQSIRRILRLLSHLHGLNRGRVLLGKGDDPKKLITIRYSYGLTSEEIKKGRYVAGEGVTGYVYKTGKIALVQDIDDEEKYLSRAVSRNILPNEMVAYIAVPIFRGKKTIGVLAVHRLRKRKRAFQRDIALLKVIATLIGQGLCIEEMVAARTADLESKNQLLINKMESRGAAHGIIGQSPLLQEAVQQAFLVAPTNTNILLQGESGTGKELFARMIHIASARSGGPFVSINCAAIPNSLIESELFGYERGAFTGAVSAKIGRMEMASGGTLLLDEIGDLELALQAKLLRVIEYKTIQRVGGTKDIAVDIRIVSASHKDLQLAVQDNQFRLDLFYRLNVFPLRIPALRERGGDVRLLAQHFLNKSNGEISKEVQFSSDALAALERYAWPGNIRQLENVIRRLLLLSNSRFIVGQLVDDVLAHEISPESLTSYTVHNSKTGASPGDVRPYMKIGPDEVGDIQEALRRQRGNKTRAAMSLGLTPRQLTYRMIKLNIKSE